MTDSLYLFVRFLYCFAAYRDRQLKEEKAKAAKNSKEKAKKSRGVKVLGSLATGSMQESSKSGEGASAATQAQGNDAPARPEALGSDRDHAVSKSDVAVSAQSGDARNALLTAICNTQQSKEKTPPVIPYLSTDEQKSSGGAQFVAIKSRGVPQDAPTDSSCSDPSRNALLSSMKNHEMSTSQERNGETASPRSALLAAIKGRKATDDEKEEEEVTAQCCTPDASFAGPAVREEEKIQATEPMSALRAAIESRKPADIQSSTTVPDASSETNETLGDGDARNAMLAAIKSRKPSTRTEKPPALPDTSTKDQGAHAVESSRGALMAAINTRGKPQDEPAGSAGTDPRNALLLSTKKH